MDFSATISVSYVICWLPAQVKSYAYWGFAAVIGREIYSTFPEVRNEKFRQNSSIPELSAGAVDTVDTVVSPSYKRRTWFLAAIIAFDTGV